MISWQIEKPLFLGLTRLLREFLIASQYASVHRNLPTDASHLLSLLPITTQHLGCESDVKINNNLICLSQDVLWNASMTLLSPQQRIVPYRTDIWVKLWEQLAKIAKGKQRFKPSQVAEKLLVSLICYQVDKTICSQIFYLVYMMYICSQKLYPDQVLQCHPVAL